MSEWSLYNDDNERKYITSSEREQFYRSVRDVLEGDRKTYALLLFWTGCRLQEALNVENRHIDFEREGVQFLTLKRRKKVIRFVPLPPDFIEKLDDVHHIKRTRRRDKKAADKPLWTFTARTAQRTIKKAMKEAGIEGVRATPKGLRHSFTMEHLQKGTPPHIIKGWTGWASDAMFEVYGKAVGEENTHFASVLWNK